MKSKFTLLLLFTGLLALAQERLPFSGRVISGDVPVKDIYIINKATGIEVRSGNEGLFSLPARAGDRIAVYSPRIIVREFTLNEDAFAADPYIMTVDYQSYELDEVVIDERGLTPEKLGLVPEGQKRYTPAERRLKAASQMKPLWMAGLGLLGGAVPVEPIINALTGQTKALKKNLAVEKKGQRIARMESVYTRAQMASQLNIPFAYIDGFIYYCAEDTALSAAMDAENYIMARTVMGKLAMEYLERLTDEK